MCARLSRSATAHVVSEHMYVYTHGHKSNITKIVCINMTVYKFSMIVHLVT